MSAAADVSAPTLLPPDSTRLSFRRFSWDDLPLVTRLNGDMEVMRFLGRTMTPAESMAMLRDRIIDYYDRHPGLGIFATVRREDGQCIGMAVLNHIQGEPHVQVGYRLAREFWGEGYATELSLALMRYGYTTLGLSHIVAITETGHAVSQRVLAKAGLARRGERQFEHPTYAAAGPLAWFESEREAWLAAHP